ncbi:MAG: hypothetical protein K2N67_05440 [Mucispirillum sp.]|nr:hypothetical protein [Mucispirillum sp.]
MTQKNIISVDKNQMADALQNNLIKKTIWKNVGIVSGSLPLISTLSVCENVMLPLQYFENMKRGQAESIAASFLEKFGLGFAMHYKPKNIGDYDILIVKFLRAIMRSPQHIFFILPHNMISTEKYGNFTEFAEYIENMEITVVEHSRYMGEYSGTNFMEIPYERWQTLVLKTSK